MNKIRLIRSFVILVCVNFLLVGCGSGETPSDKSIKEEYEKTVEPATTPIVQKVEEAIPITGFEPSELPTLMPTNEPVITATDEPTNKLKAKPFANLVSNKKEGSISKAVIAEDSKGNTHNDAMIFYAEFNSNNDGSKSFDKPCVEKYTGGEYSKFKATIVPHKDFDKYDKDCGAIVKVFADDELIFESVKITRKGNPIDIDVDITGIQYLTIQVFPTSTLESYYNNYAIIVTDAMVYG